ncbi:hypothetical protein SAMN04487905_10633 [Actinopolyspora xinjiangensis]|uniref:Uncharacterized protein n=1 Tax=Actinopolyspora xinjiangensis TaxID=405564 RepID=A0A1H0U444_9ACTN|nr:hypothetical protein [Actinopolyspora xinjiangensis]SDP60901.1 hypothetical protein SAMN04487905_10633 [Actinopolyspora xinjiangensis]
MGASGARLWREMTEDGSLPPMAMVLLLEACRIADRLDQLDRQLQGEAWLEFQQDEESGSVVVVMDKALAEARQQATAFKQIVAELRQASGGRGKSKASQGEKRSERGANGIADLTSRIASRRSSSAG